MRVFGSAGQQFLQRVDVDLDLQQQLVDGAELIGVMDVVVDAREGAAEGDDVADALGVGAAADDHRLVLRITRDFLVGRRQRLHQRGIDRIEQRLFGLVDRELAVFILHPGAHQLEHLLGAHRDREADVDAALDDAVLHMDDAGVQGQGAVFIAALAAHHAAVALQPDVAAVEIDERILQARLLQTDQQMADRIDAELRRAGMGGDARHTDDDGLRLFLNAELDAVVVEIVFQLLHAEAVLGDLGHAGAADHVGHRAALDIQESGLWAAVDALDHALLAVDAREIPVRREAEIHIALFGNVVSQALGAALLVGAHDQADALVQRRPHVAKDLQRDHAADHRALVIADAAAVDSAAVNRHLERIRVPAFGLDRRPAVPVADDADQPVAFAHLRVADVIVQVHSLDPVFFHHLQSRLQNIARSGSERRIRQRFTHDARIGNQLAELRQELVLVLLHICLCIHQHSTPSNNTAILSRNRGNTMLRPCF